MSHPLRLKTLWYAMGIGLIVLIAYLSLTAYPPPIMNFRYGDKVGHFLAYGSLGTWFTLLVTRTSWRWAYTLVFIAMGMGLEVVQGMGGLRHYDYYDMLANSLGALLGMLATAYCCPRLLLRVERWLGILPAE